MKAYTSRPEYSERVKQLYRNDPRRSMMYHARSRAKKNQLECTVTLEDIVIPKICPILGIPIIVSETGRPSGNSPSLDRIRNEEGYTENNIRVISHRANSLKREHTLETLEKLIQYIKGELPY